MPVRVEHKLDRLVADLLKGHKNFRADRRVLIVDDKPRVAADGHADVATRFLRVMAFSINGGAENSSGVFCQH